VNEPVIDYRAVFQALPGLVALLTPEFVYADVNEDFLRYSGRSREDLIGRYLFEVFPDNPNDPGATGARNLEVSLRRVLASGERDTMALQRYDVQSLNYPNRWVERFWSPINAPVQDGDGRVVLLVHRVEEVTELIRARGQADGDRADGDRARVLEAELYTRARELQDVNDRLRLANAREREVALALQDAMLPPPLITDHQKVAVRYQPAATALNVCGDWYDLVDLAGEQMAVAVGDVVGHGLAAAGVMGQLRSALSAAMRVSPSPAQALEALGLYARAIKGAESTTAVSVYIDWTSLTLTYSSAGHLPPALLRGDGTVVFLDQATDPPLGARVDHMPRPEAQQSFSSGDILVLYTDGLVERRSEDIDVSLDRLTRTLISHRTLSPEPLADALLLDLLPAGGATDDTALVVLRL
jgi:serine phosphatase RsbU (regulator of sigma subunit)